MMSENGEKSNIGALVFGFFLIIIVAGIFFLKPYIFGGKKTAVPAKTEEKLDENFPFIDAKTLKERKIKDEIRIIDIRQTAYFEESHIIDSLSIPAEAFVDEAGRLDKNKEYVLVDDKGLSGDGKKIMNHLKENGFEKIAYLEGGFIGWKSRLNPTVGKGDPYSFTDQSKVTYIKNAELKKAMDDGENLFIIDLRKEQAYKENHLPEAVNINLADLEKRRKEIPYGKKIILFDDDELRTFQGAVRLYDMAIFNVYALVGDAKVVPEKEAGKTEAPGGATPDAGLKP